MGRKRNIRYVYLASRCDRYGENTEIEGVYASMEAAVSHQVGQTPPQPNMDEGDEFKRWGFLDIKRYDLLGE